MKHETMRQPIDSLKLPKHFEDEADTERLGNRPCQYLIGAGVLDRRQVAPAVCAVVDVADVGEQMLTGPRGGELSVQLVRKHGICLHCPGHPSQRICLPDGA